MAQNSSSKKLGETASSEIDENLSSSGFDEIVKDSVTHSIEGQEMTGKDLEKLIKSLKGSVVSTLSENKERLLGLREQMSEEEWNKFLVKEAKNLLELNLKNALQKRHEAEIFGKLSKESGEIKNEISSIVNDLRKISEAEKDDKEKLLARIVELEAINKKLEKENAELKKLAMIDPLCEIPNRRATFEKVEDEIARARREEHDEEGKHSSLSVLFVDLDHFKKINDTYGHPVGDLALKEVSSRLQESIERETDFVGRVGGEEFVVVLPNTPGDSASKVIAQKILKTISAPPLIVREENGEDIEIPLTASIGVAELQNGWDSAEKIIKRADNSMYIAKNSGRNRVVFN